MIKSYKDYLAEAIGDGPRIPHPEDSVLQGSNKAMQFAMALEEILQKPQLSTIKWDGGIALYFGRNQQGQLFVTDKYMPAKGVYPTSPEGWVEYDRSRGADRADLYGKIQAIWPGIEASVGKTNGVFKGDLMTINPAGLKPAGNSFEFGDITVHYSVPVKSYLGNLMSGKVALIVVHEFDNRPWDGQTGLTNVSNVAFIPPNVNLNFSLGNNSPLQKKLMTAVRTAETKITTLGRQSDAFLAGLDNPAVKLLGQYLNQIRTQQTKDNIATWLEKEANPKQFRNLIGDGESGYLAKNKAGLDALYQIWNSIFTAKVAIVEAFESQVKGFTQTTPDGPGGEGFVFPTSLGLIKLINPNFGSSHFSKKHFPK